MSAPKLHPDSATLALSAGGELSLLERVGLWLHMRSCEQCRAEVEMYREMREMASDATFSLLPEDSSEWDRLAAEMKANIRLGLAAGAIVDRQPVRDIEPMRAAGWQVAVVFASLAIVLASGWYLRRPEQHLSVPAIAVKVPAIIETRDAGIGIEADEGAMTLLRPAGQTATVAVDYGAGAKTQYVNGDTGQVTIHQVYLDE